MPAPTRTSPIPMVAPLCTIVRTFLPPRRRGNISHLTGVPSCAVAYSLANPYDGGISHPTGVPSCAVAYFLAHPVTILSHPAGKDNQPGIKRTEPLGPIPLGGRKFLSALSARPTFQRRAPGRAPIYRRSVPRKIKSSLHMFNLETLKQNNFRENN